MAFASLAALAAFPPQSASAQTIDYGALEQLFGEAVTTSATGSPQRVTDVPVNMEIVTADEIRRSGAYDIPGVLRHVLGVDVMQWNNDNADVGLRGYDQAYSPRVLVLVDGRQVYADHYGYTPWAAVPVELGAIRQIEIIKGPNAALYGFNAVSGVINIITYNPLYDNVNTVSLSGGTQGMAQASAVQTIKLGDRGGLRLTASGRVDDDFSTSIPASAGTLPRIHNDRFAFSLNSVFRLSDTVQLGFEASHAGAATNDLSPVYSLSHDRHFTSSLKGQVTAETGLGLLQGTVYRNWTSQHHIEANSKVNFHNEVTVAQLQDLFRLGTDHVFRASLEYRHNTSDTTPFVGGRVFYDNYAASGMWNWNIVPSLSLTNALRWDNLHLGRTGDVPAGYPFTNGDWKRTLTEVSYTSGIVWEATEVDALRLMVSRGDQLPSLADTGALLFTSPFANATGNPKIDDIEATNYEIDWDRSLPRIGGQFHTAAFYQESENVISLLGETLPGSGPPPYSIPANIGNSIARGVEFSLRGMFGEAWRWGANYRFESITDFFIPSAQGGTSYVDFQHVTPKHVVKANLGWARGNWEIDTFLYYQSTTRGLARLPLPPGSFITGSFLTPVADYLSVDARIAYRVTDWATLAISGQNLAQSPQQQTSGPKVERRVFATLTVNY